MAFRNQVSSFLQSIPDDLYFNPNTMVFRFEDSEVTPTYEEMCAVMGHHPEQNETPALPPGPRYDPAEIAALCPVYLPDGIDPDQGLPLEPFLNRVLSMDANPSWVWACCFCEPLPPNT
ncbi:hypothetical protein JCGZ_05061 [Jatropha curcas]|uniref:Uncharacterized protein n=1 Tax=Jatropha curcas TaxID=180498 RepID=A0A067JKJ4_JATCU|nr:hypothetical protein JCGZ_05061 [Jatropha curcas]